MNFFSMELSKLILFVSIPVLSFPGLSIAVGTFTPLAAYADSPVKDLSAVEREKLIRESLFAADNPQHDTAFLRSPTAGSENPSSVVERGGASYDRRGQVTERGVQDLSVLPNNTQQGSYSQPAQNSSQQYGSQRGYTRRPQSQYSEPRQPQQQQQEGVAVNGGGVHVNTGNNNIDRTVESFIDRKVRGAQNAIRSLWR